MRVQVIAATDVRTSDAPFLLVEAFHHRGHTASLLPIDSHLGPVAAAGWRLGQAEDPVYRASFQRRVRKVAEDEHPDAVIVYGSNWSLDEDTIQFLRFRIGAQLVLWEVNQRIFTGAQARVMPLYDHVFCLDSYFIPMLRAGGLSCVEHLCAAADPVAHRPVSPSTDEFEHYRCDVSFVGTHHPGREECLRQLVGLGLSTRIYGRGWEVAGDPVRDWVSTEPVYGWKKTVIYSASRLVFHERGPHMLDGENFRVFEAGACGSAVITRPSRDLLRCFEPNEEVVLFEQPNEMAKAVSWWLEDADALDGVAHAARCRVLSEHTYAHRVDVICDHLDQGRHVR